MVTTVKNEHGHPTAEIDGAGLLLVHVKPVHDALPHTLTLRLSLRPATTPQEDTNANVQQARTHFALLMGEQPECGSHADMRGLFGHSDTLLDLGRPTTKRQPSPRCSPTSATQFW